MPKQLHKTLISKGKVKVQYLIFPKQFQRYVYFPDSLFCTLTFSLNVEILFTTQANAFEKS